MITSIIMGEMKLFIHSQTPTVQPLNELVNFLFTLYGAYDIHAGN